MSYPSDHDQPTAPLVRPYIPAFPVSDPDPGPVPVVVEPASPSTEVLVLSPHASVGVTCNVGRTGLTGLTVARGETSCTVALLPSAVDALCVALVAATPVPYQPAAAGRGGGADA